MKNMITTENGCVDCALPCIGNRCKYRNQTVLICDKCGDETDILYEWEDEELCEYCLLSSIPKVNVEDEL